MLNKYFRVDGTNSIDFMYANIAVKNIYFALISLDYIFDFEKYNIGIYHDEHTYYFFYIQSLLTACGNISNIFYNPSGFYGKKTTDRCKRLRENLNISKINYPLVFQKEVRNTNEHFDERYEEFAGNLGDFNLLDNHTNPYMRSVIHTNPHLRTYDKKSKIYHTFIRKKNGRFEKFEYNLIELRRELEHMINSITSNPIFESAWSEENPNECVKWLK